MSIHRLVLALMIVLVSTSVTIAEQGKTSDLIGTWVANPGNLTIKLTFQANNKVTIQVDEDSGDGTYSVNWKTTPAQLDIDWGDRGQVKTIIEVSKDTLKMENADPGDDRPTKFTEAAVTLKREE